MTILLARKSFSGATLSPRRIVIPTGAPQERSGGTCGSAQPEFCCTRKELQRGTLFTCTELSSRPELRRSVVEGPALSEVEWGPAVLPACSPLANLQSALALLSFEACRPPAANPLPLLTGRGLSPRFLARSWWPPTARC